MAIKLKPQYTQNDSFQAKKGLLDTEATIINLSQDGTIEGSHDILLGYVGEHNVRAINIKTTELDWGALGNEVDEKHIHEFYIPVLVFKAQDESPKMLVMGWDDVDEYEHSCISALIPGALLDNSLNYQILFGLIEKQTGLEDIFIGNILDTKDAEIFITGVFNGYVKNSSREYFENIRNVTIEIADLSNSFGLKKPTIVLNYEKTNELKVAENSNRILGYQGDVLVTDLKINLPNNFLDTWDYDVLFSYDDFVKYLVKPQIKENDDIQYLYTWIPVEVTNTSGMWKVAIHFKNNNEKNEESYSLFANLEVKDTFLKNGLEDVEDIRSVFVDDNTLHTEGTSFEDPNTIMTTYGRPVGDVLDYGTMQANNLTDDSTFLRYVKINDRTFTLDAETFDGHNSDYFASQEALNAVEASIPTEVGVMIVESEENSAIKVSGDATIQLSLKLDNNTGNVKLSQGDNGLSAEVGFTAQDIKYTSGDIKNKTIEEISLDVYEHSLLKTGNPHNITHEDVNTYNKNTIDEKDVETLTAAKEYTFSKDEISSKDAQVLIEAKAYTFSKGEISLKDTETLKAAKIYTFSKDEIDSKDAQILVDAKAYTDTKTNELNTKISNLSGAFQFKGSKNSISELPSANSENIGHVYVVGDLEYASNGDQWIQLGQNGDFVLSSRYQEDILSINNELNTLAIENIDANRVVFSKDLVVTSIFGKYQPDSSGSVTIPTKTRNLTLLGLLEDAFSQELNPEVDYPETTLSTTSNGEGEVGSTFSMPTATLKVTSVGNYTYGPDTGIVFKAGNMTITQDDDTTNTSSNTTDLTTNNTITLTAKNTKGSVYGDSSITYKFNATSKYTTNPSKIPVTNLGNIRDGLRIGADSAVAKEVELDVTNTPKTVTFTGYRKMFWGTMTDQPATMTSSQIRALTGVSQKAGTCTEKSLSIGVGVKRVVIAVPSNRTLSVVLDSNDSNSNIVGSFKSTTVSVEGYNSYTAQTYNVYYLDYANATTKTNTYKVTIK